MHWRFWTEQKENFANFYKIDAILSKWDILWNFQRKLNSNECVDKDECLKNPCRSDQECVNIIGSYICKARGKI